MSDIAALFTDIHFLVKSSSVLLHCSSLLESFHMPSQSLKQFLNQSSDLYWTMGFPGGSEVKASAYNAGDLGSIRGGGEDPLEKEMAIHSSILAWRIPWMKEPGGLQFTGSQRVGHD